MSDDPKDTLTLIVTVQVKPEREAEFFEVCANFIEWVHANEPATYVYYMTKHPTREHTYVWVERYRDRAALEEHGSTPEFLAAWEIVRECLDGEREGLFLDQVLPA